MRYLILVIMPMCLLVLCACGGSKDHGNISVGNGRLVKWSNQVVESDKKVIFIHGCVDTNDPHGLKPLEMESEFSPKLENLDTLGPEFFGVRTTELVEYWFYGYNPNQASDKIVDDLASLIRNNSNFDDSQIAVVGYSLGGVVAWLLDQRYDLIQGGVFLGAPILSTPLAHKDVRDQAIEQIFPLAHSGIILAFDRLAGETEHLQMKYVESGMARSDLLFMIGCIDPPSVDIVTRNIDLLDTLTAGHNFMTGMVNNRQFAEIGATIIHASDWDNCDVGGCLSDGAVSVNSAWIGDNLDTQLWQDYDHWDLLSGKSDLSLDRATLQHLGKVLDLFPKFVEMDLPVLPELEIHLGSESSVWDWAKFAYTQGGRLYLTDEDWSREFRVSTNEYNYFPRFDLGNSLVWTTRSESQMYVCLWQGDGVTRMSAGSSKYASFSPSGEELVYQYGDNLVVYNLESKNYQMLAQGINLVAPPVWVENSFFADKIYFAHRDLAGTINLYSIKSNAKSQYLSDAEMVAQNCSVPFMAASPFDGVIVISNIGDGHQMITVVFGGGPFTARVSIDVIKSDISEISGTSKEIMFELAQDFMFTSLAFDMEYGQLYLVGSVGSTSGLWLLDISRILISDNVQLNDVFYLIKSDVTCIDIKNSKSSLISW